MPITKNGKAINTVEEWAIRAGPKRTYQWADGRSAKETAKCWLNSPTGRMPEDVSRALATNGAFARVEDWSAEPEVRLSFDKYRGEPRNTDLLVRATDSRGDFLLAIEAKADETFGETVVQAMRKAKLRRQKNSRSRAVERVQDLVSTLLGTSLESEPSIGVLRYQLFTATAGALSAASSGSIERVVLLIQEFRTDKTKDQRHEKNSADLNAFLRRLSNYQFTKIDAGQVLGPLVAIQTNSTLATKLFVGKVVHNLRAR